MKWEKLFWTTEEKSKFIKDEEKEGRKQGGVGVEEENKQEQLKRVKRWRSRQVETGGGGGGAKRRKGKRERKK